MQLQDYLKKAKFICGHVSEVGKNFVKIKNKIISFDYLIIASGSRYESPIKEQDVLSSARTKEVLDYKPEIIVFGKGKSSMMRVNEDVRNEISKKFFMMISFFS